MAGEYAGQKLIVLGLNYRESLSIVQSYQNTYPNIIMLQDTNGSVYNQYRQNGYIPLNYVLTQDHLVEYWSEGFNQYAMEAALENVLPAVTVVVDNDGEPVPQGGVLSFDITLHNWDDTAQTFYAITRATVDGGATYPLLGPVELTLNPGQELSTTLNQAIPGFTPLGTYEFEAVLGTYPPVEIMDTSSFGFEVVAP